jgi:hypothetical protein
MMLTQEFVQSLLSLGFGLSPTYVVPKQGNWFNPQDNGAEGFKVDTWCAYKINNSTSKTLPYFDAYLDGSGNVSTVMMVSTVDVQLVGKYAEEGVLSMAHWPIRWDILDFLMVSGMALLPQGLGDYFTSNFIQDGLNNVLAFNASFDVVWLNEILTTQQVLQSVVLPSGITQITTSGNLIISI